MQCWGLRMGLLHGVARSRDPPPPPQHPGQAAACALPSSEAAGTTRVISHPGRLQLPSGVDVLGCGCSLYNFA